MIKSTTAIFITLGAVAIALLIGIGIGKADSKPSPPPKPMSQKQLEKERRLKKLALEARDNRLWITCQERRVAAIDNLRLYSGSEYDPEYDFGADRPNSKREIKALDKLREVQRVCDPIEERITGDKHWSERYPYDLD